MCRSNRAHYGITTNSHGRALLGASLFALTLPSAAMAQDDQQPIVLEEVTVEGDPGVVTEGTGSYTSGSATVGYKHPVDLRDVPQSVNVITRERLDDANANSLEEAANILPNVTEATGNLFSGSLYSRGHEVFTYNVDGAPRPFLSIYGTAPDMVFFDRVEVLSGPSGVFQGSGEPVGTINLVRKRPKRSFGVEGALEAGTFDRFRGEVDVTGPITPDGGLRGRAIGYAETQESFVDFVEQESGGGYATLDFDVGPNTTVSVGGIGEREETVNFSGLPTFTNGELIDLPRETFVGAPWNTRDIDSAEGFLEVRHEFDFGGVAKVIGRTYDRTADIKGLLGQTGVDPATGNFQAFTFAREFEERTSYLDANMTVPFPLNGRSSEITVGADYRRTDQRTRQNFDFSAGTQNIFTFDPTAIPEPDVSFPGVGPGFRLNTETETDEYGLYGYGRLQVLDGLNLTLGARYAIYDSVREDTGRDTTVSDLSENRLVPLAGVSYDVTDDVTVYSSYSEIFQPQRAQTASGEQLDPIVGRQVEAGGKASFFDGDLTANAAVYRLEDENRAIDDPANPGASIQAGDAVTKGFETFVAGRPYPGVDLTAGYSFVDTDLEADPSPEHTFTASGKYTFQSGALADLYLGAGVRAVSGSEVVRDNATIEADGYAVVNVFAGYRPVDGLEIQLFVNNLFDNDYVQRVNTTARGTFYGEPLSAMLRVSAKF